MTFKKNKFNDINNAIFFKRRSLFKGLKKLVEKMITEDKLYNFIQRIIDEIGKAQQKFDYSTKI